MKEKFRQRMNSHKELEDYKAKKKAAQERSEKGLNAYTVFLSVVCLGIAIVGFVCRDFWFGIGFVVLSLLLGLMAFFSYRSEKKKNTDNKK